MRYLTLVMVICLLALASAVHAETFRGVLAGVAVFADGTPMVGVPVTVSGPGLVRAREVITGADGSFSLVTPSDRMTATLPMANGRDSSQSVIVPIDGRATVRLVFRNDGALVNFTAADGSPVEVTTATAATRKQRSEVVDIPSVAFGASGRWFDLDQNATDFAVRATIKGIDRHDIVISRQLNFPRRNDKQKQISIALPVGNLRFQLVDSYGRLMANTRVSGTMRYPAQQAIPGYWDATDPATTNNTQNINGLLTDSYGNLDLGTTLVGTYSLRLSAGAQSGADTDFTVSTSGHVSLVQYTIGVNGPIPPPDNGYRRVTQQVYGQDGRPAGNTMVHASYAYRGVAYLVDATTDNGGYVTWVDLPPVRVIVWGDEVTAGVISAYATNVRGPLPAPVPDEYIRFSVRVDGLNVDRTTLTWRFRRAGQSRVETSTTDYRQTNYVIYGATQEWSIPGGSQYNLAVSADSYTIPTARLTQVYAPYIDDIGRNAVLTLPMFGQDNGGGNNGGGGYGRVNVTGRLLRTNGGMVRTVSRLDIVPIDTNRYYQSQQIQVVQQGNGIFTAVLPSVGRYRVIVDMLDDNITPPANMIFDAVAGENRINITLPDPVITVTAGAQVNWVTNTDPTTLHTLNALNNRQVIDVYGDPTRILVAWFRPAANQVTYWNPTLGTVAGERTRTLTERTFYFTTTVPGGQSYPGTLRLLPLFPVNVDRNSITGSELNSVLVPRGERVRATLLAGPYVFDDPDRPELGILGRVDLTLVNSTVVLRASTNFSYNRKPDTRTVELTFPVAAGNDPVNASATMLVTVDSDPSFTAYLAGNDIRDGIANIELPVDANTLSIQWPGVGVVSNILIPPYNGYRIARIRIPLRTIGLHVAGRLVAEDGAALRGQELTFILPGQRPEDAISVITGYNGSFDVSGLLLGSLTAQAVIDGVTYTWPITMTNEALPPMVLRVTSEAARLHPLAIYMPIDLQARPLGVKLYRNRDGRESVVSSTQSDWLPFSLLNAQVAQLPNVRIGTYRVEVTTTRGTTQMTAVVDDWGGVAVP